MGNHALNGDKAGKHACWNWLRFLDLLFFITKPEGARGDTDAATLFLEAQVTKCNKQYFQVRKGAVFKHGAKDTTKIDALYWAMRLGIYYNSPCV